MSAPWTEWDHIVKIDPDKSLVDGESYEDVCRTGTDAIEVGGTTGMTEEKMQAVVEACSEHDVPLYIEPGVDATVVHTDSLDGYLIPIVFNAGDVSWMTGAHKEWVRIDDGIDWARTNTEAYIVLNPDSSVATYTQANCDLDAEDVAAYATIAERMFGQEIVYVEYSGTFGDPEIVAAAGDALDEATLFYGGGIHDYDSAHEMGERADTVVVGDLVHDEGVDAVRETVRGATDAS
ncbi:geranylgeranylglyceryl phosphate synthase-like protein [Halococcus morrhuae DSM 1307]|uniref:Geranylgeranylglyceryl phosphate synthase n=1 Tax=Halococcus morrhuae DSM 1307 TaxID=931277 RepID=M0MVF1_HALMO|nr:putative phosphoglycerol geranylgeranyltransferase [Halococcus morrhuae]EMA49727.1 geranylgeranylglyceryl phosphate synthase-like protein [Halococcus morrhuae DSM 1307]